MLARWLTVEAGWSAVALLVFVVLLPYALRRRGRHDPRGAALRPSWRTHFWTGGGLAALVLVHGLATMRPEIAGRAERSGVELAAAAALAAVLQTGFGLLLRRARGATRVALRRAHFVTMLVLVATAGAHVALTRTVRALLLPPP